MGDPVRIFWIRKGGRTPRQQGLASSEQSTGMIDDLTRSARAGNGRLFIVASKTAQAGRQLIQDWLAWKRTQDEAIFSTKHPPLAMTAHCHEGKLVGLGVEACQAIAGASFGVLLASRNGGFLPRAWERAYVPEPERLLQTYMVPQTVLGQALGDPR